MFGRATEPFYNWVPIEPFGRLGAEFVLAYGELGPRAALDTRSYTCSTSMYGPLVEPAIISLTLGVGSWVSYEHCVWAQPRIQLRKPAETHSPPLQPPRQVPRRRVGQSRLRAMICATGSVCSV